MENRPVRADKGTGELEPEETGGGRLFGPVRRWARRRLAPTAALRYDFDALALDLARGVPRREVLRQLGGAFAAALFAELTGFLALAPAPAASAPGVSAGPCSSSQALPCLGQVQGALADALAG